MNLEDLTEALEDILPDTFKVVVDKRGQVVIMTGLKEDDDGELVDHLSEDDDDEGDDDELNFDSDFTVGLDDLDEDEV